VRLPAAVAVLTMCLGPSWARAQDDVRLTAEVDAKEIGVEDQVELVLAVSGKSLQAADRLSTPSLTNLRVVSGPQRSSKVSIVNGAISQQQAFTYVLQPKSVGAAEIGPVRLLRASGTPLATEPIAISVVAGSIRPRSADPLGASPFGEDPFEELFGQRRRRQRVSEPRVAAEASAARTKVHVGEGVRVTFAVLTQRPLADVGLVERPKYPGFWSEELPAPAAGPQVDVVTRDGERYRRITLLESLVFPTKAGRLSIPPLTVRIRVASSNPFEGVTELVRATKPVVIDALAIPSSPDFSGAVGRFQAKATLDRAAVALGEAAVLRFTLSGRGNLRWVERGPALELSHCKVFPPELKDAIHVDGTGMSGSRTWEYTLVPQTGGTLTIPATRLEYFEPESRRLVRAEADGLRLDVTGGAATAGGPAAPIATSAAPALALRSDLDEGWGRPTVLPPAALWSAVSVAAGAHAALVLLGWLRRRGRRGVGRAASRGGVRAALADVERARDRGASKEQAALLIEKALLDVFGAGVEGADGDATERAAAELLSEVRFLRYAPQLGDYADKIRDIAERAVSVIRRRS
jgi:hypothetical protein